MSLIAREVDDPDAEIPLVVNLDGALIRSDLLYETAFADLAATPSRALALAGALRRGKAALKSAIAAQTMIDPALLPYDPNMRELIAQARAQGREVYIASASNERYVKAIADHIGADGWFASSALVNLDRDRKAERLVEAFGARGFDYAGNDAADLAIWSVCRKGWAVAPSAAVRRALTAGGLDVGVVAPPPGRWRAWIKLLRLHQWAKNALAFIPLLTAHRFDLADIALATVAFLCFCVVASAVYVINDLVDLGSDRRHPTKRFRPLAAGAVPIAAALRAALGLSALGLAAAFAVSPLFAAVVFGYLGLTTLYSFYLKRKMLIDIVALAALYTIRVIGGAVAIAAPVSEWLLGFSMFIFTSLALIKRYVELSRRIDAELPDPDNRNYLNSDLSIVAALAAASGFNAVTVFALYISSDSVRKIYSHPEALWLACPILMYWLARALMMAHRRLMDDDPILFALKDRNSLLAFALIGLIMAAAT